MALGKISKPEKPTGTVEGSSFRKQERKATRQSTRLSKKTAPQDSDINIREDEHEDIRNTTPQSMQRVLKSSIKKITKKPTEKRPTNKAADTETVLKTHQMFIHELLSIDSDQATVLSPVLSTPTAEESEGSVQVVNFNDSGIYQHPSHSNESYDAEAFYAAVDSHVLQLNPDDKFGSPNPFANGLIQIKELNTDYEIVSPAPPAHNQPFSLDVNIDSPSQPVHIPTVDPTSHFVSPASFPYFEQLHPNSDLALPTAFAPNQFDPDLEFGSRTPYPHDREFNPAPGFGSTASFGKFRQLQPPLDFSLLTHPTHVKNLDSAFELGSPNILDYAQQYNKRLDSEPPQSLEFFQQQKDAIGTEKLPSSSQVQVLDPRLQAEPLLGSEDKEYDSARNKHHNNYIHHPGSSLFIQSSPTAQHRYHYSQPDMSASSLEDQTRCAHGISSLIAPIPKHGTKADSGPTESSIDRSMDVRCSVEAAQKGLWHEAMNKHGIYRPRGMTQVLPNGITQWREHTMTRWCNAVKYEDIRGQLLVECAELGQYTYPREKGELAEDITVFHPDQKDWAFEERHLRPDILHQYEKRGYRNPCYPVQIWLYHGAVVLDNENQPILDFKNIPKAISSQVEGGLQEAITRQDSRIEAKDFRVRMLLDPKGRGGNSMPGLSAISMRRSRFRWRAGYLSWTPRTGSDDLKKYLDSILPAHCKAANSTRDFRELRPFEVKQMSLENRGKYLSRAGRRLLSPEARKRSEVTFKLGLRRAEMRDGARVQELRGEDEEEEGTDSSAEADPPLRPTMAHAREWMRDTSDQELDEHRERIMKIFAPHCESWEDLDSLEKFAVDSWDDLEEVGAITYDGNKPVLNYEVIRELIKHILDGKRVSEYYLFKEYDENAARLLG